MSPQYQDDDAQRALDYEAAEKRVEQLKADARDRALRLGMRGSARAADDPALLESLAKQALMEQYVATLPEPDRPKGPARRKAPKTNKRKAQRQARKRNR